MNNSQYFCIIIPSVIVFGYICKLLCSQKSERADLYEKIFNSLLAQRVDTKTCREEADKAVESVFGTIKEYNDNNNRYN